MTILGCSVIKPVRPHLGPGYDGVSFETHSIHLVYSTPEGTELSGIYEVGSEEHDRWNGTPDDRLPPLAAGPWGSMTCTIPPKAFLIHPSCWSLLKRHFANEINLDRLFEVCRFRPASRTAEYMGFLDQFSDFYHNLQHPLQRPTIRGIGDASKQIARIQRLDISKAKHILPGADCFGILPMEVRLEIATYLPTVDFLNLRTVSRMMATIFSLQSFWKTRFRINGDRGYLAGLTENPSQRKNWRSIYHCTATNEKLYHHHWSMRRQWRNDLWLRDRYSMTKTPSGQTGPERDLPEVAWMVAAAEVRCERVMKDRLPRDNPAPCMCDRQDPIPMLHIDLLPGHIALTAFILTEGTTAGTTTHIIGFDLISADGGNRTLGYRLPGSQVTVDLCNRSLRGFKVVADDRGIRALRPVFNGETVSWIGDPQQDRTTNLIKITLEHEVKQIAAKFDVSPFHFAGELID
ncbi:unnamed protein product [Penicillium salamii]|uniref:F-box domain-containing protein n=1 Tax=Penicillium salamii TaxID=1612424 RepID=A0A9W4NEA5_9EURO|nr:unnamed protein product [Penicillium salamii]CAG7967369.1 unnamed protein product [Penicillium salamii]CAG7992876.1 unnamed protein product [Penicillium salamii]CAG8181437.1 unnamed protein product [Penicillium salamii]CAG8183323.1 unnamed protein product [Penicillium salamii]